MKERAANWYEPKKKGLMEGWGGQVQEDPLVAGERGKKAGGCGLDGGCILGQRGDEEDHVATAWI